MGLFTVKETEKQDYKPLPEGNYECVITKAGLDATKGGTEYINITLKVRKDLDNVDKLKETNGKYHNRNVYVSIYKRRDTGEYSDEDLSNVMTAAGIPVGTEIASWDQFSELLQNKPVRAFVKVEDNTYQGKTTQRNRVWPNNFYKTDYPLQEDPFKDSNIADVEVNDNDLPF
ncbi:DUF669 domain-containing protein [Lactobacillus sp.]|uniref:DUF669 domain-containing protein n=1 Tax=Lactobacillus sp. TaxID=1591 RepID=UPI0019938FB2|nr:DUF669 domain-containing protein [Lactobacillus sp.]MBD5429328.1 DUF669 domain-containing protein [Lactobacillus sp.]